MVPSLFDKNHFHLSKIRAQNKGVETFIFERVAHETQERLGLIQRDFSQSLDWALRKGDETGFDLITSMLELQAKEDVVGELIQIRLALKSDGLFLGTILGGETLQELRLAFLQAESELGLPHMPHILPFMDVKTAGALMQRAGFALPVVESEIITLNYGSLMRLFEDLRRMGATNGLLSRSRKFMKRQLFMKMLEVYETQFSQLNGKKKVTLELLHLQGWSPHESQQKPMQRGSVEKGFHAKNI